MKWLQASIPNGVFVFPLHLKDFFLNTFNLTKDFGQFTEIKEIFITLKTQRESTCPSVKISIDSHDPVFNISAISWGVLIPFLASNKDKNIIIPCKQYNVLLDAQTNNNFTKKICDPEISLKVEESLANHTKKISKQGSKAFVNLTLTPEG